MFAKLINPRTIQKAPTSFVVGDTSYCNPTPEQYKIGEYYEVIEGTKPEPKKWYHIIAEYILDESGSLPIINTIYEYEKDTKPNYSELIVGYIREVYSLDDELALQRQRDNSEEKHSEFEEYNAFCDQCKVQAKSDIQEWENA